ncbi:Aste57867_20760 [Aphanomyces stellatus]|uniref:Aste57867_20760 protein n=1 Tax=Aphanomyces stellatus TaxID=120398 RepID=A0A485LHT6_9STRA|nr:hypothetical protein As57867_020692 [Aphanomyces stellatus]VFT97439.1 Aste57867_20760 [Aphanomyces stellatus]
MDTGDDDASPSENSSPRDEPSAEPSEEPSPRDDEAPSSSVEPDPEAMSSLEAQFLNGRAPVDEDDATAAPPERIQKPIQATYDKLASDPPSRTPPARPPRPADPEHDKPPQNPSSHSHTHARPDVWVHPPRSIEDDMKHDLLTSRSDTERSADPPPKKDLSPSKKDLSPSKPPPPARPIRPRPAAPSSRYVDTTASDDIDDVAPVVTFDVGGTLFKCKARLLEKYPNKRLHRLFLCGCERTKPHEAIFVDRNPAYFSLILDWYRMGTYHIPDSLSLPGLQHEAMYFDVFADMFPKQVEVLFTPPMSSVPTSNATTPTASLVCFCKTFSHTMVPSHPPLVFVLRAHEQLILETASGVGRLLLRVTDLHGITTVPQAVLYDSHSYFFLGGGPAKLHGTPFPGLLSQLFFFVGTNCVCVCVVGNLIYTFWAERLHDINDTGQTAGSAPIHVEFKIRYMFHTPSEQISLTLDEQQMLSHTLNAVAKSTSVAVTTQALVGLGIGSTVVASFASPSIKGPAKGNGGAVPSLVVVPSSNFVEDVVVAPVTMPTTSLPVATSLPNKTKERAQLLDEAQQFQTKVKEHQAWLQHYQREMTQNAAIPTPGEIDNIASTALGSSPKKYGANASQAGTLISRNATKARK